jgi:hypothetical protein
LRETIRQSDLRGESPTTVARILERMDWAETAVRWAPDGRFGWRGQVVHRIDGDPRNNDVDNMEIRRE